MGLESLADLDITRQTTESEVVSVAYSLNQERIPAFTALGTAPRTTHELGHSDNQATILVVKKGFSPKLRHISRTRKVELFLRSRNV